MLGWLALVSSGVVFARRLRLGEVVRNVAIWGAIAGVAILGYSFRDEAVAAFQRVRGEVIPAMAVPTGDHAMTVTASDDGGFYVMGQVNGAAVRFAIDTGANGVRAEPGRRGAGRRRHGHPEVRLAQRDRQRRRLRGPGDAGQPERRPDQADRRRPPPSTRPR